MGEAWNRQETLSLSERNKVGLTTTTTPTSISTTMKTEIMTDSSHSQKLSFPKNKLFGRDKQLKLMMDAYHDILHANDEKDKDGRVSKANPSSRTTKEVTNKRQKQNDQEGKQAQRKQPSYPPSHTKRQVASGTSRGNNGIPEHNRLSCPVIEEETSDSIGGDHKMKSSIVTGDSSTDLESISSSSSRPLHKISDGFVKKNVSDLCHLPAGLVAKASEVNSSSFQKDVDVDTPSLVHGTSKAVFMSGHSGVGKTALVFHFVWNLKRKKRPFHFTVGKCTGEYICAGPLEVIDQAMGLLVSRLMMPKGEASRGSDKDNKKQESKKEEIRRLHRNLDKEGLMNSPEASLLVNFLPSLKPLLFDTDTKNSNGEEDAGLLQPDTQQQQQQQDNKIHITCDLDQLKFVFRNFIRAISTKERPFIWHVDDMQWATGGTLELLSSILSDPSIQYFYFIGTYRPNEIGYTHLFRQIQDEIPHEGQLMKMELSTLSPQHIGEFIASTLNINSPSSETPAAEACKVSEDENDAIVTREEPTDELATLTELLYGLSLGNMFFCRQALEELARKQALFFDEIGGGRWKLADSFRATSSTLRDILSDDVIELVKSKLNTLPVPLRRALTIMSHIRYYISLSTLLEFVNRINEQAPMQQQEEETSSYEALSYEELKLLLDQASDEGIVLKVGGQGDTYKFSHNRIQESAYRSLELAGFREYNWLRLQIAKILVLLAHGQHEGHQEETAPVGNTGVDDSEWMFFLAIRYFNAIPRCMIEDPIELARLNLRVAKLYLQQASVSMAATLLREAVSYVEYKAEQQSKSDGLRDPWQIDYQLCLSLYESLIEIEFAAGNIPEAKAAIQEVLAKAKTPNDKCVAHLTHILITVQVNNENKLLGVIELIQVLNTHYGESIPHSPTRKEVNAERSRLNSALRGRPVSALADLPLAKDDRVMNLFAKLCRMTSASGAGGRLEKFVFLRAMSLSVEQGITKYLPEILTAYCVPLRKDGKLQECYGFALVVKQLFERFPGQHGAENVASGLVLHSAVVHLRETFSSSLGFMLINYQRSFAVGNVEIALVSAMHYAMFYCADGLPLNNQFESRLIQFEAKSKQLKQAGYTIIFKMCRQFMYNLQGKTSSCPTKMKGTAIDETRCIQNLEGNSQRMTLRDLSIFRLFLACIYGDINTMVKMMERLESCPLFDLPIVRQHLRFTFHGIAAFIVGRQFHDKKYTKIGQQIMKEVKKLDQNGSGSFNVNARPVYLCLRAVECNKVKAYVRAIAACQHSNVKHLEAIMSEQCGKVLRLKKKLDVSKIFLGKAMWLYYDWGAMGKVNHMKKKYMFLQDFPRSATIIPLGSRGVGGNILSSSSSSPYYSTPSSSSSPLFRRYGGGLLLSGTTSTSEAESSYASIP